ASSQVVVSAMGLGCAQMGNLYRTMSRADAIGVFDAARAAGIRYFDTAPFYGFTRSERRLGALLTDMPRESYALSTKVGRLMRPDPFVGPEEDGYVAPLPFRPVYDYTHDGVLRAFEDSRQRLGILCPDILYVHDIGRVTHGDRHAHYWDQLTAGGGFAALMRLRMEGAVRAIGLGVNEAQAIADALEVADLDICLLAGRYTLLEQDSLALMDRCAARGVGIVAAGAFNSGILAGGGQYNYSTAPPGIVARVEALRAACAEAGVAPEAAALQFPLAHPAVLSVAVGAHDSGQVRANVASFEAVIPTGFWHGLKAKGLIAEAAPVPA
ncbi:MAG: aldo/keto reductase, partial [Actinomycetospora chiangmaiensis]|nr:aldo/keto reductase [Actinomycetospora chiangmaiensis]